MNPNGVVPTLVHDGRPVVESSVIVEYINETFPDPPLSPADAYGRARMRAWLRYIDEVPTTAIRVPSLNMTVLRDFARMDARVYEEYLTKTPLRKHFLQRMGQQGFSRQDYDNALERLKKATQRMARSLNEGAWLAGDELTLADLCMAPLVDRMVDLGMSELWEFDFPEVSDWYERLRERPSFARTFYPCSRLSEQYKIGTWNALVDA